MGSWKRSLDRKKEELSFDTDCKMSKLSKLWKLFSAQKFITVVTEQCLHQKTWSLSSVYVIKLKTNIHYYLFIEQKLLSIPLGFSCVWGGGEYFFLVLGPTVKTIGEVGRKDP